MTPQDTLKISEEAWAILVERIGEHSQPTPSVHAQRRDERYKTDKLGYLAVDILQPGGTTSRVPACANDISATGLRIIHKRYFHPGSACICWLPGPAKPFVPLPGTVKWCQHLEGMLHCSGIALDQAIDAGHYA